MNRYEEVLERDWQQQVLDTMQLNGWKVYHTFDSRRSAPGFPDIIGLHPASGDRLAIELKREKGRATPEQLQWLAWFEECGIESKLWRPSDVDEMIARVRKGRT